MIPRAIRCYLTKNLHRRLFVYFGAAILLSGLTATLVVKAIGGESPWQRQQSNAEAFIAGRFVQVWDDPAAVDELAHALSDEMELNVLVTDAASRPISSYGDACGDGALIPVWRGEELLGF